MSKPENDPVRNEPAKPPQDPPKPPPKNPEGAPNVPYQTGDEAEAEQRRKPKA